MQGEHHANGQVSAKVAKAVWGLLLIWTGAALLLHWSWGVGLVGAGVVLVGAQALRGILGARIEGFGLVAGVLLVLCGVWDLLDVAVDLMPLLAIAGGIALLLSATRRRGGSPGERPGMHAPSHPRT